MRRSSCSCTQTSCYVGVGWGGVARNVQVYFHTHVMLRYCTAFLHLHKHVMLRYCTFFLHLHAHVMLRYCTFFLHLHTHTRHATVLDVLLALAHTHTSCYATARSHVTLLRVLLALAHTRHATLLHVLLALAHTHTSCQMGWQQVLDRSWMWLKKSCRIA